MQKAVDLFEQAKLELLDLSLKNSLIYFKQRKAYGVGFSHSNLGEVYEHLVWRAKPCSFTTDFLASTSKISVDMDATELKNRLNKTYRQSRLFIEEKGINTLFLAVGFIKSLDDAYEINAPLVLIPVELKRKENSESYYFVYSTEEVRENISIITKLKNELNLDLTYKDEEINNLDNYFRYIIKLLEGNEKVTIDTEQAAIDFFSYTKLLMYRDLDVNSWLNEAGEFNSDICEQLFLTNFTNLDDEENIDLDPIIISNILDSDSSQSDAINTVMSGKNLVLQGPPGTGKSQTITNIIAAAVRNNKSVLFVSDKMAALDVVKKRLESVGLGDLVLELHSHKTNKKHVLKSLEQTLSLGEPKVLASDVLFEKYKEHKNELNDYKNKLNLDIRNSGYSLSEIYAEALRLDQRMTTTNIKYPELKIIGMMSYKSEDFIKRNKLLKEYINVLNTIGKVERHPLYGIQIESCMPFEQIAMKDRLVNLDEATNLLVRSINDMMTFLNTKSCGCIFDSKRIYNSLIYLANLIDLDNLNCADENFSTDDGVELINSYIKIGQQLDKDFNSDVFSNEVFLDNKYQSLVKQYLQKPNKSIQKEIEEGFITPGGFKKKLSILENHFILLNTLLVDKMLLENIFKESYKGVYYTDWDHLAVLVKEIVLMHKKINEFKIVPQVKFVDNNKVKILELVNNYDECYSNFKIEMSKFINLTNFNSNIRFGYATWYEDMNFSDLKRTLTLMKNNIEDIDKIASYNSLNYSLIDLGLKDIVDLATNFKYSYDYLLDIFSFEYYDSLINYAYELYPELNEFKKYKATRLVEVFKELDMRVMIENIKKILEAHWKNMPKISSQSKDMSIIRRELQKKRNHMPIRKLISKTSDSITKIKPVFMMSPLSIASYLAPQEITFDLVVFDEASQVRPVEAFGALLRGNQVVVVGDSKQLPPTSFFDRITDKYEEVSDEDYDISNMESILSLLLAKNVEQKTLQWHYRSRHQSLIAFANNEFYENKLKMFPSVYESDDELGLVFNYHPDTIYDRGGSSTNKLEAKYVIEYALKQAKRYPKLTMGVASFSIKQQEVLIKEFESQMRKNQDPELKEYFNYQKEEPFFIKNLENVQGDERDIVLISIGYGFDENRKLSMDFGPLNKNDGERRLNVLITRAKEKCVVFSNIKSSDINLSKTNSFGVEALKHFLSYAEHRNTVNYSRDYNEQSLFVKMLNNKIKQYGYETDINVGSNVGIDIAIYDPELQRFVCGIETDFGMYRMIDNPTDRERIRPGILNSLGWKIYHIWSNDYYKNPKAELENIFKFIDLTKDSTKEFESQKKLEINLSRKNMVVVKEETKTMDYRKYSGQKRRSGILLEPTKLIGLVEKIAEYEAPIHLNVLKRRILEITNMQNLNEIETNNLGDAIINSSLIIENEFLIVADQKIWIRNRKNVDLTTKKVDNICDLEVSEAIIYVIDRALASTKEEIIKESSLLLGFNRNVKLMSRITDLLGILVTREKLYIDDNIYYIEEVESNEV